MARRKTTPKTVKCECIKAFKAQYNTIRTDAKVGDKLEYPDWLFKKYAENGFVK